MPTAVFRLTGARAAAMAVTVRYCSSKGKLSWGGMGWVGRGGVMQWINRAPPPPPRVAVVLAAHRSMSWRKRGSVQSESRVTLASHWLISISW